MKVRTINAADIPSAKPPVNKLREEIAAIVRGLEPGKAVAVTLENDETIKGMKSRFSRAGKSEGRNIRVFDSDGRVYIMLEAESE